MWKQMTFEDIDVPTGSPELPGGNSPCSSPDGPASEACGPVRARANRTRRRASARATPTNATCGPPSPDSSASAALQQSLVSKLAALLSSVGSTEYAQTWKRKVTPSGSSYSEHTASKPRTSASGCIGWPTPTLESKEWSEEAIQAYAAGKRGSHGLDIGAAALLSAWATPTKGDAQKVTPFHDAPQLAAWPTPQCADDNNSRAADPLAYSVARLKRKNKCSNLAQTAQAFAAWPTPMAGSPGTEEYNPAGNTDSSRKTVALLAGWCTTRANDSKGAVNVETTHRKPGDFYLPEQAALCGTTGATASPLSAETGSVGAYRLNPAFSAWLMGFPQSWDQSGCRVQIASRSRGKRPTAPDDSGATETPSACKRRRSS